MKIPSTSFTFYVIVTGFTSGGSYDSDQGSWNISDNDMEYYATNQSKISMHGGISTVEQWIDNLFPSASDVIAGIVLRNSLCPTMPQGHRVIDFPVILLSDPSTSERANSAVTFLESCGFSDVRFVHPFTRAGDIDLQQLMANGAIDDAGLMQLQWSAKENWLLSLSVILNHMAAIRLGIESGSPYFGVFEDDLMLGCGVEAARAKLLDAILELPPDADMLYLEYCLETCSRLSFRAHRRRIVPAHRPLCCAAVVFTAAGARRDRKSVV